VGLSRRPLVAIIPVIVDGPAKVKYLALTLEELARLYEDIPRLMAGLCRADLRRNGAATMTAAAVDGLIEPGLPTELDLIELHERMIENERRRAARNGDRPVPITLD
jgi:hypothetical protein